MSKPVIKVEHVSKNYIINHQHNMGGYATLRDIIAEKAKSLFKSKKENRCISSKDSEIFWALDDVSFEVNQGDRVGIIGRNGAGKSTLLKILSKIVAPTKGKIILEGRVASLLEVGTGFHPELTGRENIYLNGAILGMTKAEIKSKFDEIVDFSGVEKFLDTPVKRFSSGMYVRLAFAVAAYLEPEILIVDEVLAVGDVEFQKKCLGKLQDVSNSGRTILFVSHNIAAITHLCSHGILLANGKVVKDGEIKEVIGSYQNIGIATATLSDRIHDRKGNGMLRLIDFKICNHLNTTKTTYQLGECIQFILKFSNPYNVVTSNLRIIIGVYNSSHEGILRFDTNNTNVNIKSRTVNLEVKCKVNEHLNIKPDMYFINVALMHNYDMLDYIPNVATFTIENFDYFGSGRNVENPELSKVYYKHQWEINEDE